jgi:hypothetical protein
VPIRSRPAEINVGGGGERRRRFPVGRVLVVVVVLGIVAFWAWIFSGAPRRQNPDYLSDRRWVAAAERTCASTRVRLADLPNAATTDDADKRARVLDRATDHLDTMVDGLADPPPGNRADADLASQWVGDWRRYLAARRDYADRLRVDPDARLLLDEKFDDPLDTVIETFAKVNDMPSCATPGDVG